MRVAPLFGFSVLGGARWRKPSLRSAARLLLSQGDKADGPLGRVGWCHELADRVENAGDRLIVGGELALQSLLQVGKAPGQLLVAGEEVPQPDEGTHDLDVDGD